MGGDGGIWVTSALSVVVCIVGLVLWNNRVQYKDVGASYYRVVALREVHKVLTAPLAHANVWHIGINIMLLWGAMTQVEAAQGWEWTLRHVALYAVRRCASSPCSPHPTALPIHARSCCLRCYSLGCKLWLVFTIGGFPMCACRRRIRRAA
jgi:hypothetical protein